jgi:hypothetical protein
MPRPQYHVELTEDGRFAVVAVEAGARLTVAEFHGEQAALTAAAAINQEPVRAVAPRGRWLKQEAA